ncbi:hypothetical protein BCF55_1682 [Hydrogenivirga caldilitoris]|uniref:Permease n=1 Tax=Hydrogenivirga caldilitoris TaxID=246264 RepID=A0A497XT80_9AQUI|nr:permease [Hydrogenivirga caldilitoris]RLJ71380.1 hypothetical protein BCF55_1682 [Hydrogenivirga caldilitoris]
MIHLEFLKVFWDYTLDVLPYFLLAALAGATLQTFVGDRFLSRKLLSSPLAPFFAAMLGATVPVCSCSMIPIARAIDSLSGKSYAPVVAFLVTAPVLSPVVLVLTAGMLGMEMTLFRVAFPLLYAMSIAYLSSLVFKKHLSLPLFQGSGSRVNSKHLFVRNLRSLLFSTGKYLLLGLAIAALIKVLTPPNLIASFSGSILSYPLISLLSVPVYVCSGEEVPIGRSLRDMGMSDGQVLTFMLASSGICIPTIAALFSFLPRKLVLLYTLSWFVFATLVGMIVDFSSALNLTIGFSRFVGTSE